MERNDGGGTEAGSCVPAAERRLCFGCQVGCIMQDMSGSKGGGVREGGGGVGKKH